jgi:hypothetical protein
MSWGHCCDICSKEESCQFVITVLQFEREKELKIESTHASWIFDDTICNDFQLDGRFNNENP